MARVQKTQDKIDNVIDSKVNKFLEGVDKTQKSIYDNLLSMVKELKLNKDGTIKQTVANLKLANRIRATVENIVINPEYEKKVSEFLESYDSVKEINDSYLKTIEKTFDPNKLIYQTVKDQAVTQMTDSLLTAGINENVIKPVEQIVVNSITEGASFSDMVDQLKNNILDDNENLGTLRRYASQITWDGTQIFNRSYTMAFAKDTKKEWWRYSSGLVKDSRSYCRRRQGRYFHTKEIEDSASERWSGKMKGTNSSSIFRYCGGYNCRHHYTPVLIDIVPKAVIERNIKNGNYKK